MQAKQQKNQNSARGAVVGCPNFSPCPLCYGCRNYSSAFLDCEECLNDNKKFNICNTELHQPDKVAMFITKQHTVL